MPLPQRYIKEVASISISDIRNIESESGIIATILLHPDLVFHSDQLTPHHFSDEENGFLYYAIGELAKRGVEKIDAYGIQNILNAKPATQKWAERITIQSINDLIEVAPVIARDSVREYKLMVDNVMNAAFRRDALIRLRECESMCMSETENDDIRASIYKSIEDLVCRYQNLESLVPLGQRADEIWESIRRGQSSDSFVDFKFPSLNRYARLSRTDAIVIAAREKRGKSLFLLNCAVDLLRKGKRVLVIDTELDTKLYFMRLLSHLTGVEFSRIRDGNYTSSEEVLLQDAISWIKSVPFTHVYQPAINDDQLISITKKHMHQYGLDVVILDYLKGNTSYFLDAYQNSATLGKTMDTLKNYIAGELNLYVLTAVQCTNSGAVADSQKIIRNCSTLLYLERKSPDQIEADGGLDYGNMILNVRANRNGEIQGETEYISLTLDGNRCMFRESLQPVRSSPY